jgi:hypothetical protein
MKTPSTTLIHLLIGKSIIETLVVGALAVAAFVAVVPPTFHGWGEVAEQKYISGWAVNNASPWERVSVQLFVDGKFAATATADQSRSDVSAAGWAKDPWHGYTFPVNTFPVGLHVAQIYALHSSGGGLRQSLQQLGDPVYFQVGEDGKVYVRRPSD